MQRTLTESDDLGGHPFRRSLPSRRVTAVRDEDSDLKLFVLSFTAFFICFYTFVM
jgi:hypothetical protein